jgi:hypothetical protein
MFAEAEVLMTWLALIFETLRAVYPVSVAYENRYGFEPSDERKIAVALIPRRLQGPMSAVGPVADVTSSGMFAVSSGSRHSPKLW